MRFLFKLFPLLAVSLVISCGQSKSSDGAGRGPDAPSTTGPEAPTTRTETISTDGSNIDGIYAADMFPINHNLQFTKVGKVALQREGDNFKALAKVDYGSKHTNAIQGIYTGRCPNFITDNSNKDAYIDIQEALPVIGKMIIPLDGILDSQQGGSNVFPLGDGETGRYFYNNSASFSRMFADLKVADENPNDNIVKLAPEEGLALEGKIVVIQGLTEEVVLPATVGTIGVHTPHKVIPVSCGVLKKAETMPEELIVTE